MKTKINLEFPFSLDYKAGYLNINKEPRRVIALISNNNSRTSISYARYLMSCNLKRYLNKNEHVDHIDNNKLNDAIDNLQILSPKENNLKKNKNLNIKLAEDITLICPFCNFSFTRPSRNIKHKLLAKKQPCCSKSCATKFYNKNKEVLGSNPSKDTN